MAQIGAHKSVAVSMVGKIKTTAQMIAIPFLLYHAPIRGLHMQFLGTWLIYVAAVLTLWSMAYYLRMAWPHLVEQTGNVIDRNAGLKRRKARKAKVFTALGKPL